MKLSTIMCAIGVAATSAAAYVSCGIPLPGSLAHQLLVNDTVEIPDLGAADIWNNRDGPKKWPRNRLNQVVIQFCYNAPYSRRKLSSAMEQALKAWKLALGPPSKDSGHGVIFAETFKENGEPLYCEDHNAEHDWNPAIPYDTVAIMYNPRSTSFASYGYTDPPAPWRSHMTIEIFYDRRTMTHEWGHVLGMVHEHQRNDRDTFVKYQCEKLPGYAMAAELARRAEPNADLSLLCTNMAFAARFDFEGREYVKGVIGSKYIHDRKAYDYDSIMTYNTFQLANSKCNNNHIWEECALVKYAEPFGDRSKLEPQPENQHPSKGDAEWVKTNYPWVDPPK